MRHPSSALNSSEGGARWNRTNGAFTGLTFRIVEREILFLRSTDGVLIAGIAPRMAMLSEDMERFLGKINCSDAICIRDN
jgi:hypothetical protein